MENTTATLHQESAYQNSRQLIDGNAWEETIAHELFHQWFGDLVTTESWSNITVNESLPITVNTSGTNINMVRTMPMHTILKTCRAI